MTAIISQGDAASLHLPDSSVDLVITSPPYFGLRSYTDGGQHYAEQIGAEATPAEYLDALIACTREWVRVLKPGGSIFVNLGDKYSTYEARPERVRVDHAWAAKSQRAARYTKSAPSVYGSPYKSLMGLPWRYALACTGSGAASKPSIAADLVHELIDRIDEGGASLDFIRGVVDQLADQPDTSELGLTLRQEIVWSKRSAMPTRLTDRCRRTHEHVFHFTKGAKYFADVPALSAHLGLDSYPSSVWDVPLSPFTAPPELGVKHHAAFPMELVRRIVLGWSPVGGVVLDPFGGTGTTALIASTHGRVGISNDLSSDYCRLARWRTTDEKQRAKASTVKPNPARKTKPQPIAAVLDLPVPDGQLTFDDEAS